MTERPNENIEMSLADKKAELQKLLKEVIMKSPEYEGKSEKEVIGEIIKETEERKEYLEEKKKNISKALKEYKDSALKILDGFTDLGEATKEEKEEYKKQKKEVVKNIKNKKESEFESEINTEIAALEEGIQLWKEILSESEGKSA